MVYPYDIKRKEKTTMKKPEEKFNEWLTNAVKGKEGFEVVYVKAQEYVCRNEDYIQNVTTLFIMVWKSGEPIFCYKWKEGENKDDIAKIAFVIKKQKKMMLYINTDAEKIYSFGMENTELEEIMVFIFYQVRDEITFIAASSESKEIKMINAIQNEECNVMPLIVGQIGGSLQEQMVAKQSEEEVSDGTES